MLALRCLPSLPTRARAFLESDVGKVRSTFPTSLSMDLLSCDNNK